MEDKDKLDKAIEQAIRQVGKERDAEDLATLKGFMARRQQKSKVKKYIMSVTSIAAIIAIVFSLNIYQDNRRMDKLFETYYTPLEYDSQLMSRGEETISPELASAMESYQKEDYATALQKFEAIPDVDENYLIYKAICLLETEQTEDDRFPAGLRAAGKLRCVCRACEQRGNGRRWTGDGSYGFDCG